MAYDLRCGNSSKGYEGFGGLLKPVGGASPIDSEAKIWVGSSWVEYCPWDVRKDGTPSSLWPCATPTRALWGWENVKLD